MKAGKIIEMGGYDDLIMAVVNWNSGARDWILEDLVAWKRQYGLDFIFFDSLGNLGLKTRNYAAALEQFESAALWRSLPAEGQRQWAERFAPDRPIIEQS